VIGPTCILAGDQFFYTHPQTGTLIVGARDVAARPLSPGHDDDGTSPGVSPASRTSAARAYPVAAQLAVVPASLAAIGAGSHLWVG